MLNNLLAVFDNYCIHTSQDSSSLSNTADFICSTCSEMYDHGSFHTSESFPILGGTFGEISFIGEVNRDIAECCSTYDVNRGLYYVNIFNPSYL